MSIVTSIKAFLMSGPRRFFAMAFLLLLLAFLLVPQAILFLRAGACGAGFSDAQICRIFRATAPLHETAQWDRSGYKITTRELAHDAGYQSYNILTGKMTANCGFWIGAALQNGTHCAEGENLRRLEKGELGIK